MRGAAPSYLLRKPWNFAPLVLCAVGLTASGCSLIPGSDSKLGWDQMLGVAQKPAAAPAENPAVPNCLVEFRTDGQASTGVQIPVSEGMCVQDAIRASGALKKFSRIKVQLARQLPNGNWHKMDVPFRNGKDRVEPAYDYGVRPGDRLIIIEDTTSTFDEVLGSVGAMFGL